MSKKVIVNVTISRMNQDRRARPHEVMSVRLRLMTFSMSKLKGAIVWCGFTIDFKIPILEKYVVLLLSEQFHTSKTASLILYSHAFSIECARINVCRIFEIGYILGSPYVFSVMLSKVRVFKAQLSKTSVIEIEDTVFFALTLRITD